MTLTRRDVEEGLDILAEHRGDSTVVPEPGAFDGLRAHLEGREEPMALHYAPDLNDMSETPCQAYVHQLVMEGEDVTDNKEGLIADRDACPDCKKHVEEEMGKE